MSPLVPEYPTKLPGELWGITAYYNPAGYKSKLANLKLFSERVRAQGLKLLIVELAFGDSPFEVTQDVCDILEQRRTEGLLWQKERLLNIALGFLPKDCDKVAWLDGDIFFENENWVGEVCGLLETYVVVQPFQAACWLPKGLITAQEQSFFGVGQKEGQSLPGMAYAMSVAPDRREALSSYFKHGHTGFAWSARKEVLDRHGLYDCQILGNGDFVMAHAMYGNEDFWNGRNWECTRLSPQLLRNISEWGRKFYADVRGSVFFVSGRVFHLWHGSQVDRQYNDRLLVLKDCDFDPTTDIVKDSSDCWIWNSDKPKVRHWAMAYFYFRKED